VLGETGRILHRIRPVKRVQVDYLQSLHRAAQDALGLQPSVDALPTKTAFLGFFLFWVIAWCTIGAGADTVTATDAFILLVDNDAIFTFIIRLYRTDVQTGWVFAMVTGKRVKSAFVIRVNFFTYRINLSPDNGLRLMVLVFASHGTGETADTSFCIDKKSILFLHRVSPQTLATSANWSWMATPG
jgi:hypothetical protein